jgi:hypothetical protein
MSSDPGARLTSHERDAFLHQGITARLACLDARGWPYSVPLWHHWDGERFWIIGSEHAAWVRYLLAAPRAALLIDDPATLTRVMCQGIARHAEGPSTAGTWTDIARAMAVRYLGPETLPDYERNTAGLARWLFVIEPDRMVSWRGPGRTEGEPQPLAT